MVDALGGVDVCLATNLDDYEYPNYSNAGSAAASTTRPAVST